MIDKESKAKKTKKRERNEWKIAEEVDARMAVTGSHASIDEMIIITFPHGLCITENGTHA